MSEPDVSQLLTVRQAIDILDAVSVRPRVIRVPLNEAQGHCLAEDLLADRDYPPFDKSLMDGYAVRSSDVAAVPVWLKLIGEVAAGQRAPRALGPGEAYAIMTGAPIPPGADGVVPVEDTRREGDAVRILQAGTPQRYIARQGADLAKGQPVLARGARLESAQLAAAASIGAAELSVYARPIAAVLATGDELVPVSATPGPAQIRNSNTPMLLGLLRRLGCQAIDLGHAIDQPDLLRAKLREGLAAADVLFVTGGMSMGAYDYVPRLLADLGADLKITKLRIKPGKPFVFGMVEGSRFGVQGSGQKQEGPTQPAIGNPQSVISQDSGLGTQDLKFVFGLPGNPVSSFACTVRLASRLITRLSGGAVREKWTSGVLADPLPRNGPREFYQPVRLQWDQERGQNVVHPLAWKGSADLFTLAMADGLLVRPEDDVPRDTGAAVRVLEV